MYIYIYTHTYIYIYIYIRTCFCPGTSMKAFHVRGVCGGRGEGVRQREDVVFHMRSLLGWLRLGWLKIA